jgi:predicted amidohydrolase
MRVNVLEVPASWGAPVAALAAVDAALARAPRGDLALLPELALTGYVSPRGSFDAAHFAETVDGPTARALADLAERHRTTLVGSIVLREGASVANAVIAFGPDGAPTFVYRKRHPWFPETWASPGTARPPVATIAGVATTICVCFDVHFVADDAAEELQAADLLLFPSAWVDEEDTRLGHIVQLAQRFGIWVAAANWSAGCVVVPGQGGSCVVAPDGRVVARARGAPDADGIEIVTAEVA